MRARALAEGRRTTVLAAVTATKGRQHRNTGFVLAGRKLRRQKDGDTFKGLPWTNQLSAKTQDIGIVVLSGQSRGSRPTRLAGHFTGTIRNTAPTTLEGAAIKARYLLDYAHATVLEAADPSQLDYGDEGLRQFIGQLASLPLVSNPTATASNH